MSADLHDLLDRGVSPRPSSIDGDALVARGRRRRAAKRAGAGVLAGVVLLAGGVVVTNAVTGPDAPIVSEVPGNAAPEWRQIHDAPIDGRTRPTLAVDGDRVAVWGGQGTIREGETPLGRDTVVESDDHVFQDGAVVDLTTGVWQTVGELPVTARRSPAVRLAGGTLLVWGGVALPDTTGEAFAQDLPSVLSDGALHDLDTGQWTPVPAMPLAARYSPLVEWDGERLFVWGGDQAASGAPASDGAVWTAIDGWTTIADFPLTPRTGSAIAVDDERLVVWGGGTNLDPQEGEEALTNDGAVYDRASDSWTVLPAVDLPPGWFSYGTYAPTTRLDGDRFLVAGGARTSPLAYSLSGAWLDLSTGTWTPIADAPTEARYIVADADGALAVDDATDASSMGRLWAYDPVQDTWTGTTFAQDGSVVTPWSAFLTGSASSSADDGRWAPVTVLREDGATFRPALTDDGETRDFISLATTESGVVLFGGIVHDPDGGGWFGHDGEHRADGWFLPNP